MTKGFITLGIDTDEDKIKHCYALASSIKISNPDAQICLVVDHEKSKIVPNEYLKVFDYITELPFGNTGYKDGFHGSNFWQIIHATPFDETIYVDYDTLFLNVDAETLWQAFSKKDFAVTSSAFAYRNQIADKSSKFEFEKYYNLPELYNSLVYFKRESSLALEWFKMADPVFQNWRDVYVTVFKDKKPQTFNKNLLANIVTRFVDAESDITVKLNNYYDLDNKSQRLWSHDVPANWTEMLNYWFVNTNKLIIENSAITSGIVHYCDEKFLTKEVLDVVRSEVNITSKRKSTT